MLKLLVKEVAEREGVENALELSKRAGLHYQTVYSLWRGESRMIGLQTIEKLCRALGVRPGQLFQLKPEIGDPAPAGDRVGGVDQKSKSRKRAPKKRKNLP